MDVTSMTQIKLNEALNISSPKVDGLHGEEMMQIQRVPGGWIYWRWHSQMGNQLMMTGVFVPEPPVTPSTS